MSAGLMAWLIHMEEKCACAYSISIGLEPHYWNEYLIAVGAYCLLYSRMLDKQVWHRLQDALRSVGGTVHR
jgi:hypothetical protein